MTASMAWLSSARVAVDRDAIDATWSRSSMNGLHTQASKRLV